MNVNQVSSELSLTNTTARLQTLPRRKSCSEMPRGQLCIARHRISRSTSLPDFGTGVSWLIKQVNVSRGGANAILKRLRDLAEQNKRQKDYHSALRHLTRALAIHRRIYGDQPELMLGHYHRAMGYCYGKLDMNKESIVCFEQSLAIYRVVSHKEEMIYCCGVLAAAWWELNEYSQAIHYAEQALELHRDVNNHSHYLMMLHILVDACDRVGDAEKSNAYLVEEQQLEEELSTPHFTLRLAPEYAE